MNKLPCSLAAVPCLVLCVSSLAQGPLTPPGAPAPTMKSLDQLEARTPISTAPFTINTSGSYYLTKNLVVPTGTAITINANDVTLDLNGFTISSTQNPAASASAISIGPVRNVAVSNGVISSGVTVSNGTYSGTGFGYGIYGTPVNARVSQVSVAGVSAHGIYLGTGNSVVDRCVVDTAGGSGIVATSVFNSTALRTLYGIQGSSVNGCYATASLNAIQADTVSNSYGSSTGSNTPGILANNAINCWGAGTYDCGVRASNIENCYGTTTGNSSGGGVYGVVVNNSRGDSSGSCAGLRADQLVSHSYGFNSSSGHGLVADNAEHCSGYAAGGGNGVDVALATACTGTSAGSGRGINALIVNGCSGKSGSDYGIWANTVNNSRGVSSSGDGIRVPLGGVVSYSYGSSANGSTGIGADVAIGCSAFNNDSVSASFAAPVVVFSTGANHAAGGPEINADRVFDSTGVSGISATHRYFMGGPATYP